MNALRNLRVSSVLALGLCASAVVSTAAAKPEKHQYINAMELAVAEAQASILVSEFANDYTSSLADVDKAKAALELNIVPAVKEAKGKGDLVKAIKEYYVAAKSYFASLPPTDRLQLAASNRLKMDMEAKGSALELERELDK